jgi:hypothetical protein
MSRPNTEDFYIGYLPKAPAGLAGFVRRAVICAVIGSVAVAAVLLFAQRPFGPGTYEFLKFRDFEGVVEEQPVPFLIVERPGILPAGVPETSRFPLVKPGKHGATQDFSGLEGQRVTLKGSLIYRGDQSMIEVVDESTVVLEGGSPSSLAKPLDLGRHTLRGEIVDSKCFLGLMKPGRQKPHRSCAARCISGGIPPILLVETEDEGPEYFYLTGKEGDSLSRDLLDFIAEPVQVTGRVWLHGDILVLAASVSSFERLTE